jgi:hypothetical protein
MVTSDEDDGLPFDHESANKIAAALRETSSKAAEIVREHADYYDEVLPTLLLAEIGRWLWSTVSTPSTDDGQDVQNAIQAISRLFESGSRSMRDIIATGLLESLPQPHEPGREVVERLPAPLREELRRMESGTPD